MIKYRHCQSKRVMSYEDWVADDKRIKAAGGIMFETDHRISLGILEPVEVVDDIVVEPHHQDFASWSNLHE